MLDPEWSAVRYIDVNSCFHPRRRTGADQSRYDEAPLVRFRWILAELLSTRFPAIQALIPSSRSSRPCATRPVPLSDSDQIKTAIVSPNAPANPSRATPITIILDRLNRAIRPLHSCAGTHRQIRAGTNHVRRLASSNQDHRMPTTPTSHQLANHRKSAARTQTYKLHPLHNHQRAELFKLPDQPPHITPLPSDRPLPIIP